MVSEDKYTIKNRKLFGPFISISNSQYGSSGFDFVPNRGNLLLLHRPPKKTLHISASNTWYAIRKTL